MRSARVAEATARNEPLPHGVRIGIDYGSVRIGVAASDPEGTMAFPVATVKQGASAVDEVLGIVDEREGAQVFVGLPRGLGGHEGVAAKRARAFAGALVERLAIPVRLIDERFSTTQAATALGEAGLDSRRRRSVIDQAAAVVILERALDTEKRGNLDTVAPRLVREGNDD